MPLKAVFSVPLPAAGVECSLHTMRFYNMLEINPLLMQLKDIQVRAGVLRGYL